VVVIRIENAEEVQTLKKYTGTMGNARLNNVKLKKKNA
jgi:hypothetical protein